MSTRTNVEKPKRNAVQKECQRVRRKNGQFFIRKENKNKNKKQERT